MQRDTLIDTIIHELEDLKAKDLLVIDVSKLCNFADAMIICSATSSRHCNALFNKLTIALKNKGVQPFKKDHSRSADWMIADYGDVVVHIMQEQAREFYSLEKLWFNSEENTEAAL